MKQRQGLHEFGEELRAWCRILLRVPFMLPMAHISPAMMIRARSIKSPHSVALLYGDEQFSSRELAERMNQYSHFFQSEGAQRGSVVAVILDNRPEYLFAVLGLNQIGAVSSLINVQLTGQGLVHGLEACKADKILVGEEHYAQVIAIADLLPDIDLEKDVYVLRDPEGIAGSVDLSRAHVIDEEVRTAPRQTPTVRGWPRNADTYCYIYTSGTTGLPKAANIRNQRMLGANITYGYLMHRCGPGDVIYVSLPMYHSSAMFLGIGPALVSGATLALRRKFSVSGFWDDIHRFRATSFVYIGELCRYLLSAPTHPHERDHHLRVAVGNGMAPGIWEPFQQRFGIPKLREFYGSTEGNAFLLNIEGRPGRVGKITRNQALLRCDPTTGEVHRNAQGFCERVRPGGVGLLVGHISPLVSFEGYVDKKATRKKILEGVFKPKDRYFNSGDLLKLHDGGWLSFTDRVGDTFRWKGENVSTGEVAEVLAAFPCVTEVNVYGVEVPGMEGRAGMAALRTEDGFDLEKFAQSVREDLAPYQRPVFLRLLQDEMRITGTFKQQKVDYREEAYDLDRVRDPLYMLQGEDYQPWDAALQRQIERGEARLG